MYAKIRSFEVEAFNFNNVRILHTKSATALLLREDVVVRCLLSSRISISREDGANSVLRISLIGIEFFQPSYLLILFL